jgi:outer membrane protein TolC
MTSASNRESRVKSAALTVLALVGGCAAVRPVVLAPSLPAPPAYVADLDAARKAPAHRSSEGAAVDLPPKTGSTPIPDADGPWWRAFADPALDAIIEESLRNNYTMRDVRTLIYENQLDPARPNGPLWPLQIGIPATLQHSRQASAPLASQGATGTPFNTADVGIVASYQLDVWGQIDMQRRISDDLVEQQRQNTERSAQTIALQVAQLWFEILEQRAQRDLLATQVQYNENLLAIVNARFEQHLVGRLVVLQQEQQLLNTRAQVPLIVAQLALLDSRLRALLGRAPTSRANLVPQARVLPDLPTAPALGAPADLLRNSPDLRLQQARVAEAEHLVSQNLASWLPTINLIGSAGMTSYVSHNTVLTNAVGISLNWPIFDGGQRVTRAQQLSLTVMRRNWLYQGALHDAIQRVQDALIQERQQAEHLQALRTQVDLGRRVLVEARQLFEQGLSDYLPVLTALANLSSLERAALQAQKLLLSYRIQLYFALGGTWTKAATRF